MPADNLDVMRRIVETAARGDYGAVLADLDPEVAIDDTDILDADDYRGHASFAKWLARWDESWESWRVEELEVRGAGDDQAVALFQMVATGRGSSVELTRRDALVGRFRDGKALELAYYNDQPRALSAAGLKE